MRAVSRKNRLGIKEKDTNQVLFKKSNLWLIFRFALKMGTRNCRLDFSNCIHLHPCHSQQQSLSAIVSPVNKLLFLSFHCCEDIFQQSKVDQNSVTELLWANMFWNNVIGVIICDKTSTQTFRASTLWQSEWRKVGAGEVSFIISSFDSYQLVWNQNFVFHVSTDALPQNYEKKKFKPLIHLIIYALQWTRIGWIDNKTFDMCYWLEACFLVVQLGHCKLILLVVIFINWSALQGFPSLRKTLSPLTKHFSRVFEITNQLLTCHSFYWAPWINGNAFCFWKGN